MFHTAPGNRVAARHPRLQRLLVPMRQERLAYALPPVHPRSGLGSGIQVLSWKGPLLPERNSFTQARMPGGLVTSAPIAPIPPALATAMERLAGHAPAIGASKIGSWRP